ncbi:hypothetical protein [Aeromonas hydrophila]|uniref:hypothetical protein n=1 Tax=Aeromonas hydrophila TaxID=644 RepID=UPI002B4666FD|nr:hypothetical protein [Aeromonas hydrophila]
MDIRSYILSDIFIDGKYCEETINSIFSWLDFHLDRLSNGFVNEPGNLYSIIRTISGEEYIQTPWFGNLNPSQLSKYISLILLANLTSHKPGLPDIDTEKLVKAVVNHNAFGDESLCSILKHVNLMLNKSQISGKSIPNEYIMPALISKISEQQSLCLRNYDHFSGELNSIFKNNLKKEAFKENGFVTTLTRLMTSWLMPQCNYNKELAREEMLSLVSKSEAFKNTDLATFKALIQCSSQIDNAIQLLHANSTFKATSDSLIENIYNGALLAIKNDINKKDLDVKKVIEFCAESLPRVKVNEFLDDILTFCESTQEKNSWMVISNILSKIHHVDSNFRGALFERALNILKEKFDILNKNTIHLAPNEKYKLKKAIEYSLDTDLFLSRDFIFSFDTNLLMPELTALFIRKGKGLSADDYMRSINRALLNESSPIEGSISVEIYTLIQELTSALASKHLIPSLRNDNFNIEVLECVMKNGFDLAIIHKDDISLFDGGHFGDVLSIEDADIKKLLSENENFIELAIKRNLQNKLMELSPEGDKIKVNRRCL